MSYYLVPCLAKLREEINQKFPDRDKRSDGWIGDTSHAARKSSHNPDWANGGAVRAIDIDVDDNDPRKDLRLTVIDAAKGDPRVWYIISNGIIWSRTYNWRALKYTGSNQHFSHVHISAVEDQKQWTNTRTWFDDPATQWDWNPYVVSTLALVQQQFQIAAGVREGDRKRYHGIAAIQNALNVKAGARLAVDGWVGQSTLAAWKRYEKEHGGTGRLTTPDPVALGPSGLQILYRFTGPETD